MSNFVHKRELVKPIVVEDVETKDVFYFKSKTQASRYLETSAGCIFNILEKGTGKYKSRYELKYGIKEEIPEDKYTLMKIKKHVNYSDEERKERQRMHSKNYIERKKKNDQEIQK